MKVTIKDFKPLYKIGLIAIVGLMIVSLLLSFSYALWNINYVSEKTHTVNTACFNVAFSEQTASINLENAYPISDEEGLETDPYTFTISNNVCEQYSEYVVTIDIIDATTSIDLDYIKVALSGAKEISPTALSELPISSNDEEEIIRTSYILDSKGLNKNESKEYSLRLWLAGNAPTDVMTENLEARITITTVAVKKPLFLADLIIEQGGGVEAIEARVADFTVAPMAETSGIYMAEDDYGNSYYYRGVRESLNNNVIFGGFQWKVVRINGDGSIRLIYNGTEEEFNTNGTMNTTGLKTWIYETVYAWNTTYGNDVKYVGYMYGGVNGAESTSYSLTDQISTNAVYNETDSNAKLQLDGWYENYLAPFSIYLSDNLFCNDRSLVSGNGYGRSTATYGPFPRLGNAITDPAPTLKCPQKNDAFTVSDTIKGNGALTNPIGLITIDEALYGGLGSIYQDTNQYLYTNQNYWTFSPYGFSSDTKGYYVSSFGLIGTSLVSDGYKGGLRATINLKSDVQVTSGDGSETDPYIILTNIK